MQSYSISLIVLLEQVRSIDRRARAREQGNCSSRNTFRATRIGRHYKFSITDSGKDWDIEEKAMLERMSVIALENLIVRTTKIDTVQ